MEQVPGVVAKHAGENQLQLSPSERKQEAMFWAFSMQTLPILATTPQKHKTLKGRLAEKCCEKGQGMLQNRNTAQKLNE